MLLCDKVPKDARLLIDPARVTCGLLDYLDSEVTLVEGLNPSTLLKAQKTEADTTHIREAMAQDGAALCEFFAWLDSALGRQPVSELTIDEMLTQARERRPGYVSPSFATIAGFNANGAMPHYRATETEYARIEGDGLLLIDSGGQYLGGTTDITRMVAIGTPSAEQKQDCARVLKGVIALSRTHFPKGILSPLLDAIARAPLWTEGVNYGHGTGHGVGYFLNVHEGPQVIAYQAPATPQTAMLPGMITSIEPGTYRPGRWGVRIGEPGDQSGGGEYRVRRFSAFRDPDPVPDRHSLHRDLDAERRGASLAEQLSRSRQGPVEPVASRRSIALAAGPHRGGLEKLFHRCRGLSPEAMDRPGQGVFYRRSSCCDWCSLPD